MVSILHALRALKDGLPDVLSAESILQVCRGAGHRWRRSPLNPAVLIELFIMQVLCHNTACTHLPHLSGLQFSASAYCQARKRLPLRVFRLLAMKVASHFIKASSGDGLWHGHRVWRVDGSSASMPDTPALQAYFGQPGAQKPGCGFPVTSTLTLMHGATGIATDLEVRPLRTHEMSGVAQLHERLEAGDVLLGDRGFCSYAHICLVSQRNAHAVFRAHQRMKVDFRPHRPSRRELPKAARAGAPSSKYIRRLGENDQLVEYLKPKQKPKWMSQKQYDGLPGSIIVREIRYHIYKKGYRPKDITIVTTLLDPEKYPAKELADLYGDRWEIEVDFRHQKSTMGMEVLHCKTVEGVLKELWIYMIVYNCIRHVMLQAAKRQKVPTTRISFIDALRWICSVTIGDVLAPLIVNPDRPGRVEPRVIKRRPKPYPLMTQPRQELKQALFAS